MHSRPILSLLSCNSGKACTVALTFLLCEPQVFGEKISFRDPEDGAFDASAFLDSATGFLPIVSPITEPAVGYGAFGALMFIQKAEQEETAGFNRPNLDIIGGASTENGTNGFGASDIRHWMNDRLKTSVTYFDASVNLDYYGSGKYPELEDNPISYSEKPQGFSLGANYRLGQKSRFWAGLKYTFSNTEIGLTNNELLPPELQVDAREIDNASITPSFLYDSRNSIFTPTEGYYFSIEPTFYNEAFGGDRNYEVVDLVGMHFLPLAEEWTLGIFVKSEISFGDIPFYMLPSLDLRGISKSRYRGEDMAEVELEARWQYSSRQSLVGFAGAGATWTTNDGESTSESVLTGGVGWRYLLARRYGIHGGIDVGFGPDSSAFYFVVGSAWNRP